MRAPTTRPSDKSFDAAVTEASVDEPVAEEPRSDELTITDEPVVIDDDRDGAEPELPEVNGWIELAKQSLLVGLAVLFYFAVRGITEGSAATAIQHGRDIMALEQRLGIALEPASQDHLASHRTLTTLANWVYIWGHWPVIVATLVWLHERHRYHYLLLRNAMFISGAIGLLIFVSYPVAPPRLIGAGFVDTVTEMSTSYRLLQPPSLVNKYAAIPSLHVGWNLLVGIALWRVGTTWRHRVIASASPVLMTAAVLMTANHYLLDAVAGAIVALIGLLIALRVTLPLATRH
ncbi:MAG: phosphatase PAP2 family protein [Acidimicrobiales bacterium]